MPRFLMIIVVVLIVFSGITYLLHRIFKNRRIKYLPALGALALGIYNFYLARRMPQEGFQDIARMLLAMMWMSGFLAGMASGIILDYISRKEKR